MSPDAFTVLVVCTGNLNRSALAAALLQTWAGWYLPANLESAVRVRSAGLAAPVGRPMRTRTRIIAESLGADGSTHRASQVSEHAVRSADLVLVASRDQVDKVLGLAPTALRTTFTIREAGRIAEALDETAVPTSVGDLRALVAKLGEQRATSTPWREADDIVDPQGRGEDAYVLMARQEVPALARLATLLLGMPSAEVAAYDDAVEAGSYDFEGTGRTAEVDAGRRPRGRRRA